MKSIMNIFTRYVASAAGIAIILLVINLFIFFSWLAESKNNPTTRHNFIEITNSLTKKDGRYEMSQSGMEILNQRYEWAMLLDDSGTVIWSRDLPKDFPLHYTASDVASFTRWYYRDYPVNVWEHPDGLLVMGSAIGGSWKHDIEMPEELIGSLPVRLGLGLLINIVTAIFLAFLFGLRMFRSIRPLLKGITDLAENKSLSLSTDGILGEVAVKLNQTSEQLMKQEEALKKRDSARTTWIAGVSHDIRTPLSMVMGYASQLEENQHLAPPERKQAGIIRRESEKIKSLVSDLNLASKLEYDMQPLRMDSVNLAELVRRVITDRINNGLGEKYTIDLMVTDEAQRAMVTGDEYLLLRAITNLLNNSIQHNPDGCNIKVAVEKEARSCSISIADDGVGFPDEVLKALSNPTNPASLETRGLGLTIVQQIIKSHGGSIEFTNQQGISCSAVLRLPYRNSIA